MKIRIGQVFRVSGQSRDEAQKRVSLVSYSKLTQGSHPTGADIQKGVWAYKDIKEPNAHLRRIPAIILHSNPFKEGSLSTPWVDIIEPDLGYTVYYGDNRHPSASHLDARGNSLLARSQSLYSTPALRALAPPILLFRQCEVTGNKKGYREFCGYGIPTGYMLVSQKAKASEGAFTNLALELSLFRLDSEKEEFDWRWIDQRRDPKLTADETLAFAPLAWRTWVKQGPSALEKCRRWVTRYRIINPREQANMPEKDRDILEGIRRYFQNRQHLFESLASLIAQSVIGEHCRRGWITKRSGDGGIDFVCRVDLGTGINRIGVVVLGQAKCQRLISGKDLARLAARLQRGWVGVFVTTGVYSRAAQDEMLHDHYPVILIDGKRLAREVQSILNREGLSLLELLERESLWYQGNLRPLEPGRILDDIAFSTMVSVPTTGESIEVG